MNSDLAGAILISQAQVARVLGVSLRTVQYLVEQGALPVVRIGRRAMVHQEDLQAFVAARRPARVAGEGGPQG